MTATAPPPTEGGLPGTPTTFFPAPTQPRAKVLALLARIPWLSVLSIVVVATTWEILGRAHVFRVLPALSEIGAVWLQLWNDGEFDVIFVSLKTFGIGIVLSIIVSLIIAIFTSISRTADYVLKPFIDVAMSLPITAVIPILIIIFGLGEETRIAVVFLYSFFIITVNMQAGVKSVDPTHIEMARTFAASQPVIVRRIVLRSALPLVVTGIRLGITRGIKGMINAEVIIGTVGIGALLIQQSHEFDIPAVFAVTGTIVALGMVLIGFVALLEWFFLRKRKA
jgi:NitT/TauT family transport system permease protein